MWKSCLIDHGIDYSGSALAILKIFRHEPYCFLLESSLVGYGMGRYSFVGFDPYFVYQGSDDKVFDELRKHYRDAGGNEESRIVPHASSPITPFPSGMMGYISYDSGLYQEKIRRRPEKGGIPECLFGFYDCIITIDHVKGRLHVTSTGLPEKGLAQRRQRAQKRLNEILARLSGLDCKGAFAADCHHRTQAGLHTPMPPASNFTKGDYKQAVSRALDYIRQGEIYQVNLSQRFSFNRDDLTGTEPFEIYQRLRLLSPSCFGAYMDCRDFQIISSSPERFLSRRGLKVQTRPMKGTRPRGENKAEDARCRQSLTHSRKDRAELLMITDLERNDLGRVCRYGSIKVKTMRALEAYQTVFQATSTIEGVLRDGVDNFDLIKACFPGGSVTGCPKIRAMRIIDELEPDARSVYTGSMGYMSFDGTMDLNILIRTLIKRGKDISFHVGGGIVADSTPENEYQETLVKARAMMECLQEMRGGQGC